MVQARDRGDGGDPRIGFTVTKRLGNAVVRNRIKRRLREAVRTASGLDLKRGHDYVFIGRAATAAQDFEALVSDLISATQRLNEGKTDPPRQRSASRTAKPGRSGPNGNELNGGTRQNRQ